MLSCACDGWLSDLTINGGGMVVGSLGGNTMGTLGSGTYTTMCGASSENFIIGHVAQRLAWSVLLCPSV